MRGVDGDTDTFAVDDGVEFAGKGDVDTHGAPAELNRKSSREHKRRHHLQRDADETRIRLRASRFHLRAYRRYGGQVGGQARLIYWTRFHRPRWCIDDELLRLGMNQVV